MADADQDEIGRQRVFAASAAALVATHVMADKVWQTYFPELPPDRPEYRTILMEMHRRAFVGDLPNKGDTYEMIETSFDVTEGTARKRIDWLQEQGFLVEVRGNLMGEKGSEVFLVPSAEAKEGLSKVGLDYLLCLNQVADKLSRQMAEALTYAGADPKDIEWLADVRAVLRTHVTDYATRSAKLPEPSV
jgi:hypothetical protein